jgi:hypothetical protein
MRHLLRSAFVVGALVAVPAFAEDPRPGDPATRGEAKPGPKKGDHKPADKPVKPLPPPPAGTGDATKPAADAAKNTTTATPAKPDAKADPTKKTTEVKKDQSTQPAKDPTIKADTTKADPTKKATEVKKDQSTQPAKDPTIKADTTKADPSTKTTEVKKDEPAKTPAKVVPHKTKADVVKPTK